MHKLITHTNPVFAQVLHERLTAASIKAFIGQERSIADLYFGGDIPTTVWLDDKRNADRALEILQAVEAEILTPRCRACGYSLVGHSGETICPECGAAQTASAADQVCPACHESVPAGFETCWNCGADAPA